MVSLSKGQSVSLTKAAPGLTKLHIGLGWDAAKGGLLSGILGGAKPIDLDASLIIMDASKSVIDMVWFRQLKSKDGSTYHTGDNLTGDGDGDDEVIKCDLTRLNAKAKYLVVTVNSFRGQKFNKVDNAECRIVDDATGQELAKYSLSEKGEHTGVIMAVVTKVDGAWELKALGVPTTGQTALDMVQPALALL